MKTKILADFQICIIVPLKIDKLCFNPFTEKLFMFIFVFI